MRADYHPRGPDRNIVVTRSLPLLPRRGMWQSNQVPDLMAVDEGCWQWVRSTYLERRSETSGHLIFRSRIQWRSWNVTHLALAAEDVTHDVAAGDQVFLDGLAERRVHDVLAQRRRARGA